MMDSQGRLFRVISVNGMLKAQLWTDDYLMDWYNRETKAYEKRPVKGHWRTLKPGPLRDWCFMEHRYRQAFPS